jgi:hypothetical protein
MLGIVLLTGWFIIGCFLWKAHTAYLSSADEE